jgi:DNA-directed RNA polymerase specialized sigma24 family protein
MLDRERRDLQGRRRELVAELLEEVTDHCREVLMLYMQSVTMAQIAELVGYQKESKARKAAYRCRKQLRQRLESRPQVMEFLKSLL